MFSYRQFPQVLRLCDQNIIISFFAIIMGQSVRYIFNVSFLHGIQMTTSFQEVPLIEIKTMSKKINK